MPAFKDDPIFALCKFAEVNADDEHGDPVREAVEVDAQDAAQKDRQDEPDKDGNGREDEFVLCLGEDFVVEREKDVERDYRGDEPAVGISVHHVKGVAGRVPQEGRESPLVDDRADQDRCQIRKIDPSDAPVVEPREIIFPDRVSKAHSGHQHEDVYAEITDPPDEKLGVMEEQDEACGIGRNGGDPCVENEYHYRGHAHYRAAVARQQEEAVCCDPVVLFVHV